MYQSPLSGIQAANRVLRAGNVVPSPTPSKILRAISQLDPPDKSLHNFIIVQTSKQKPYPIQLQPV